MCLPILFRLRADKAPRRWTWCATLRPASYDLATFTTDRYTRVDQFVARYTDRLSDLPTPPATAARGRPGPHLIELQTLVLDLLEFPHRVHTS